MKKIPLSIYQDYPEQPYISPDRDISAFVKAPERFPYGLVEKKQMQRLPEGILPGHIIMLWRIHFNNFTSESMIPAYFEYRYGVDSTECIETLIKLGYAKVCTAKDSLDALNMPVLKEILKTSALDAKGKKADLLHQIAENIPEQKLAKLFDLRKYAITPAGRKMLEKYDAIVQKHGPKM